MTVKFKDESERIDFGGKRETITAANLTWEKYQALIAEFPVLKDKFVEIEDAPVKTKKAE